MQRIYGYIQTPSVLNNAEGGTAPFGEMNSVSRTFSSDIQEHHRQDRVYNIFTAIKDNVRHTLTEQELLLLDVILDVFRNNTGKSTAQLITSALAAGVGAVTDIAVHDSVQISGVSWPIDISITTSEAEYRFWMTNEAFQEGYPDTRFVVVPPVDQVDDLLGTVTSLKRVLTDERRDKQSELVFQAQQGAPATRVVTLRFRREDSSGIIYVPFNVLVYGIKGLHDELLKEAIEAYILAHTALPTLAWKTVYPEIWYRPEGLVILSNQTPAIPNLSINSSLFSPVITRAEETALLNSSSLARSEKFRNTQFQTVPFPFNHLALLINITNGSEETLGFKTLFPDYINVPSSHQDFIRMGALTRGWIVMMESLILAAMLNKLMLPEQRFIYRDTKRYVTASYARITWLIAV